MTTEPIGLLKEARAAILKLHTENQKLATKVGEAESAKTAAFAERDAYKAVIGMIASGRLDPDDAVTKAAEFIEDPRRMEAASGQAKTAGTKVAESIGRLADPGGISDPEADPVTSFLSGLRESA